MGREVSDKNLLDAFAEEFCAVVEKHAKYILVSGFVAISSGRARGTEDIDMIIERLPSEKFRTLHADLAKKGFVCMQSDQPEEVYSYLQGNLSVRYTRKNEPLPEMEIKFAKDELDTYQLKTRMKLPSTSVDVWFSSVNMNIAFKEEYLKSPKDMEDARYLRTIYNEQLDEAEIALIKRMIRKLRL